MNALPDINAIPVYEAVQRELISLLKSLSPEEWNYPTSSTKWRVKDIAAHLLDGDLKRLSLDRDRHKLPAPPHPPGSHEALLVFLNDLNNTWVRAAERLSPAVLIELTAFAAPKVVRHFRGLDPKGTALFSVAWAGEEESENWFDIAREYSEKWHHQQQIREAAGRPLLVARKWLSPLIATLIRGVPPVYNRHAAGMGSRKIEIRISGVVEDRWLLAGENGRWRLFAAGDAKPDTVIEMDDDTAWRLFTRNISEEAALERLRISGDRALGALIAKTCSYLK